MNNFLSYSMFSFFLFPSQQEQMSDRLNPKSPKRFKKQYFAKAASHEIIHVSDMDSTPMRNEAAFPTPLTNETFSVTRHVWFDPLFNPSIVNLKKPVRSHLGDVGYTLFAAHEANVPYILQPLQSAVIRTGFALNAGLTENLGLFGDYPNWCATIHNLRNYERRGIFIGTAIIRPHDHREIKITVFNGGSTVFQINPKDSLAELVFSACHSPDIAHCHDDLDKCFAGENEYFC